MKSTIRVGLSTILLLGELCGCGSTAKNQEPTVSPVSSAPPAFSETAAPAATEQVGPDAGDFPAVTDEPVYTLLPQDAELSTDLLLKEQSVTMGEDEGNLYRDVSGLPNVLAVPAVYADYGQKFLLPLRVCGQVELCGLDMKLRYDPGQLKFLTMENKNPDVIYHNKPDEGLVLLNFIHIKNLHEGFLLGELQFEAIAQDTCRSPINLEITDVAVIDKENNPIEAEYTAVDGQVWLNELMGQP